MTSADVVVSDSEAVGQEVSRILLAIEECDLIQAALREQSLVADEQDRLIKASRGLHLRSAELAGQITEGRQAIEADLLRKLEQDSGWDSNLSARVADVMTLEAELAFVSRTLREVLDSRIPLAGLKLTRLQVTIAAARAKELAHLARERHKSLSSAEAVTKSLLEQAAAFRRQANYFRGVVAMLEKRSSQG